MGEDEIAFLDVRIPDDADIYLRNYSEGLNEGLYWFGLAIKRNGGMLNLTDGEPYISADFRIEIRDEPNGSTTYVLHERD